ncbi:MAG: recombinase family protein [Terracidiphilus sp.]|nr:recombinase family protein [Terracidiphilus sp.]
MTNAIELIRVSTEAQAADDRASIPAQRTVNRTTVQRYNLRIVESIELADVSGASVLLAPEIQHLVEQMQSSDVGAVVTRKFSRLMRPEKFSDYALLQAFADSHTKLYLPDGPIDFGEKGGRLIGTIRAAIAGLERSEIRERCWRGKEEKRKAGKKDSPTVPFGVGYSKQRVWFYTDNSLKVKRAFEMILSGVTRQSTLARETGLSRGSIYNLLHNPIWIGWRVYDKKCDPAQRVTKPGGRQGFSVPVPRLPEEVIRVKVLDKPLISEQEWETAKAILDVKRQGHRREREYTKNVVMYSGYVFCSICGAPMIPVIKHYKGESYYYVCRNRRSPKSEKERCPQHYLQAEKLEKAIDDVLGREVTSEEFARELATRIESNPSDDRSEERLAQIERDITMTSKRRDRVVESYIDGVLTKDDRDAKLKLLDADLKRMRNEIERVRHQQVPTLTEEQIAMAFQTFAEWEFLSREDRRKILAVTVPRIQVHNYSVTGFSRLFDSAAQVVLSPSAAQQPTSITNNSYS